MPTPDAFPTVRAGRYRIMLTLGELGYAGKFWAPFAQGVLCPNTAAGWPGIEADRLMPISGAYLVTAHNQTIKEALKYDDWDVLLSLEHDHVFSPAIIEHMLSLPDEVGICSALYFLKDLDAPLPVAYKFGDDIRSGFRHLRPSEIIPWRQQRGLHQVDAVPMGCTAIKRWALERFPEEEPWFATPFNPAFRDVLTDDLYFCRRADDLGIKRYLDTRIELSHLMTMEIGGSWYDAWIRDLARKMEEAS